MGEPLLDQGRQWSLLPHSIGAGKRGLIAGSEPWIPRKYKMKSWIICFIAACTTLTVTAQDLSSLIERSPVVTLALSKAMEKSHEFSSKFEVEVLDGNNSLTSSASGTIEFKGGEMRWECDLDQIKSAQLNESTKAIAHQLSGKRVLLLTRPEDRANFLILSGAHACLRQDLLEVRVTAPVPVHGTDLIDGRTCRKARSRIIQPGEATNTMTIWRAKDSPKVPRQVEVGVVGQVFRIKLIDPSFRSIGAKRFQVPTGLTEYASFEDLIQSVVLEKVKRKMGLE
jgi:hypothetical protein